MLNRGKSEKYSEDGERVCARAVNSNSGTGIFIMADDIDELMHEVTSGLISPEQRKSVRLVPTYNRVEVMIERQEEVREAVSSICNTVDHTDSSLMDQDVIQIERDKRRGNGRKSAIWDHFENEDDEKAKCLYCEKKLSFKGGSTGNLLRHLKKKHKEKSVLRARPKIIRPPSGASTPSTSRSHSPTECEGVPSVNSTTLQSNKGDPPKRTKRKKSAIWLHFTLKDGKKKGQCQYCEKVLSMKTGSSGNLLRHLKKKHPNVEIIPNAGDTAFPIEPTSGALDSRSSSLAGGSPSRSADELEMSASVDSVSPTAKVGCASTSTNGFSFAESGLLHQESMSSEIVKSLPIEESKKIHDQLLKMIVKGYHSFDIVEDIEFQKLFHLVCPRYSLPSMKTLTDSMMPTLYYKIVDQVKSQLKNCHAVALTTDSWISVNKDSFLAITAHFLDRGTKMKSFLLGCIELKLSYTTVEVSYKLKKLCEKWNIQDKIAAVVTDNSTTMVETMHEAKFRHLPCFAHAINLMLQESTEKISSLLYKCNSLAEFFKQNSPALAKLSSFQEQMNVPVVKLKQSATTRWNSSFEMLECILKNKAPLISAFDHLQVDEYQISDEEWRIIEQFIDMLRVFYEISLEMSAEKNFSLSKTFLLQNMIKRRIELFLVNEDLETKISEIGTDLLNKISGMFSDRDNFDLITQTTFLDPRFKKYGFGGDEWTFTAVYNSLVASLTSVFVGDGDAPDSLATHKVLTTKKISLWEEFDEKINKLAATKNPRDAAIVELNKFLVEPLLERTGDPLQWWHQRQYIYPRLFTLVLRILCIPATSLPCETIFSKSGSALCEKRNRLSSKHLPMVLFLNHNLS